jgi:hypothetical protein
MAVTVECLPPRAGRLIAVAEHLLEQTSSLVLQI